MTEISRAAAEAALAALRQRYERGGPRRVGWAALEAAALADTGTPIYDRLVSDWPAVYAEHQLVEGGGPQ